MKLFKNIFRWLLGGAVFVCAFFMLSARAQAATEHDVIFYEIMWAGSSVSTSDEWFVLKNTKDEVVDLSSWSVKINDGVINLSGLIAGRGYYLISSHNKDHEFTNGQSIINVDPDKVDKFVLINTNFQLLLFDSGGALIDIAGNGKTPFAGLKNQNASMVRNDIIEAGDVALSWHTQEKDKRENLDSGVPDWATPRNSGKPVITSITSKEYGEVGTNTQANIDYESSEIGTFKIVSNIATKNTSIKSVSIPIRCDYYGDCTQNIKVIAPSGLYDEISINQFCYRFADLEISEVFPAPNSGQEEWVEIYNPSKYSINLNKWYIADRSSRHQFSSNIIVPARKYIVLNKNQTKLTLNNSGDTISLFTPDGVELEDNISWGKSIKGASFARFGSNFAWTAKPTPGNQNIYRPVSSSGDKDEPARPENIQQIKTGEANNYIGQWVEIEGEVTKTSGNTFYIDDGSGALKIYIQDKTGIDKPAMHKGDIVRVIGIMNIYREGDEPRLLPRQQGDVEIISSTEKVDAGSPGSTKKKGKAVLTTKKLLGNKMLLAAVTGEKRLPQLPTVGFGEFANSSPLSPSAGTVAEAIIGGTGLIALARVLLIVVKLLV